MESSDKKPCFYRTLLQKRRSNLVCSSAKPSHNANRTIQLIVSGSDVTKSNIFTYVYIYICMYTYIYIYVHTYILCIYIFTYIYSDIATPVLIYPCMCGIYCLLLLHIHISDIFTTAYDY